MKSSPWDTAFVTEPKFTLLATAVGRIYEVRVRSAGSLGNKSVWVSTSGTQPAPTTPPAAPIAHAVGGMFCVRLDWTFGDTRQDIRATEIWYCGTNDRAAAMRLSSEPFPSREYTHPGMSPGAGGYYWFFVIDVWGNKSEWYPVSEHGGLYAGCSTDPSDLLTQLQGALGMSQLAAELAAPIAQIGGMATDIIQRAIDIDALSERALFQRAVNSATVNVDPVTGKITSLATAAVTTDVEARLTQAEVDINAAEGSLTSAVATLETVENDLSSAQSQIAQLAHSVSLGVSDVQIADIAGQVSGAITVESAAAAQALAETAIRQALGLDAASDKELLSRSRVAAAEFSIATQTSDMEAEATARLALAAAVAGNVAALTVKQTALADGVSAAVTSITELAATVGENTAAIQDNATTSANEDAALAERINTVQASLGGSIASVQETASAAASAINGIEAKWGVKVQTMQDGRIALAGIEVLSGESGESAVVILADRLLIYKPDGSGSPRQIVTLGTVNGVVALGLDGSLVVDGSVVARALAAKTITAESGVIGDLAVNTLQLAGHAVTIPLVVSAANNLSGAGIPPPALRRYKVTDASVEALGEILMDNPWGTLAYRDELNGLLRSLDKEGQEGARAFYLQGYDGNQGYTFDRIMRGRNRHIDAVCIAMLGGIQPGKLQSYIRDAVGGGAGDDGLLQRFGLLVWPDVDGEWRNIDRWPDTEAKRTAFDAFERLDALAPGNDADSGKDAPAVYHFSDEAQTLFEAWRLELETALRSGEHHPAMESHLSKYRKLVPAIALVCSLADGESEVSRDSLLRALAWSEYVQSHAARAYTAGARPATDGATALLAKIRAGAVEDGFAPRDVYLKGWAHLGAPDAVHAAASLLCDLHHLRRNETAPGNKGGRPSTTYQINPATMGGQVR